MAVWNDYEWDDAKAAANLAKHGVSFEEAASALRDPHLVVFSSRSVGSEDRYTGVGMSAAGRLLVVVHVDTGARERIVSARFATASEEDLYSHG